jgi:adenosylcobinamide amidohydrolase
MAETSTNPVISAAIRPSNSGCLRLVRALHNAGRIIPLPSKRAASVNLAVISSVPLSESAMPESLAYQMEGRTRFA